MSDEEHSNGLSGWAGVALGRMWAEHDRSMDETLAWFVNGRRQPVNPAALQAQNQALAAENAQLRHDLAAYKLDYGNLKAWANSAEVTINQLLQSLADYKLDYGNLKAWANSAEARINQLLQERG